MKPPRLEKPVIIAFLSLYAAVVIFLIIIGFA